MVLNDDSGEILAWGSHPLAATLEASHCIEEDQTDIEDTPFGGPTLRPSETELVRCSGQTLP